MPAKLIGSILRTAAGNGLPLLPYVVGGVALGESLRYLPWRAALARVLARREIPAVGLAAVLGAISPLCTFGTVPLVIQLLNQGVPPAPLAAFLASSSLMNPQLFIMTWGGLGPAMAAARLLSVLALGGSFGLLASILPRRWVVSPSLLQEAATAGSTGRDGAGGVWEYLAACWRSLQHVGFYIVIGLLLGAAVERLVPAAWLSLAFRPGRWYSILLAAVLGVPFYACGGGVIPFIRSLLAQGMSRGAALAFFLVGPATRPGPLAALLSILRPAFIALYLVWLTVFAVAAGLLFH